MTEIRKPIPTFEAFESAGSDRDSAVLSMAQSLFRRNFDKPGEKVSYKMVDANGSNPESIVITKPVSDTNTMRAVVTVQDSKFKAKFDVMVQGKNPIDFSNHESSTPKEMVDWLNSIFFEEDPEKYFHQ